MKPITTKLTTSLLLLMMAFAFCSKEHTEPLPQPDEPDAPENPTTPSALFRFAASVNLNGQPYHVSNLHAVISIANEKNEPVITDTTLTLTLGEQAITNPLRLPLGNYKLTGFRLVHGGTYTRFAAPVAGSAKGAQVQKPLSITFIVQRTESDTAAVEVLAVNEGEQPAAFGYPAGAFDNNQSEANPYATIKVRAEISVGGVLYDNSTASLQLATHDSSGAHTVAFTGLKAGVNEIKLLKAASHYTLKISKWGTTSQLSLRREDLGKDTIYVFSTARAVKMLQAETNFKLVNNQYQPDHKKAYVYDAAGKLMQVQYIFRQADGSNLSGIHDQIAYQGSLVSSVTRYDEKGRVQSTTSFSYDAAQKITGISHQVGIETMTGTVSYSGTPVSGMSIHYQWSKPGYAYQIQHYKNLHNGNVSEDGSTRSNHTGEQGLYDYDDQINPYYFLKLPDLYLTNQNKNNISNQHMTYNGNYPEAAPYRSEYIYDADGYPTQVIRHYKSYQGGVWAHAYSTKTIFQYH